MSEFADGGAEAPAAPDAASSAPIPDRAAAPDHSLPNQVPPAEKAPEPKPEAKPADKEKPEPSKNASDAIRKANEAAKAKQAQPEREKPPAAKPEASEKQPEVKPEAKAPERDRAPDGKFAPRDGQDRQTEPQERQQTASQTSQHREAPARFSNDAKAAWESTAEPVRAEVHRAIREMEQGIQKHKASAEAYEQFREFDEVARQHGGDLRRTLLKIQEFDNASEHSTDAGYEFWARHAGVDPEQYAAYRAGRTPEQRQEGTISDLHRQLNEQNARIEHMLLQQAEERKVFEISQFAKTKPRFEELAGDIAVLIKGGKTNDISEAYDLAERLNPAPSLASEKPAMPAFNTPPLNPAGRKSITGAPSSGSDPVDKRPPSPSSLEALKRASQQLRA